MGKKAKKAKGKTKFSPLPTNDFFKDLETPPVQGLNPIASSVYHELEKVLPSTSRGFDGSPMSTPMAGLGKLVEGDVSVGAGKEDLRGSRGKWKKARGKKGYWAPVFDAIGPKGHPNLSLLVRLEHVKVGEVVTLDIEDVAHVEKPKGFCLAGYFSGKFSGLRAINQLKDSWKVYGHNFFECELLNSPAVDVGLASPVVPAGDPDDSDDVLEEVVPQEVVVDPKVEERFVREGLSYSEAFLSNLNPVGDSEEDLPDEAEDLGEELEPDVDDVGDSKEELERDDFIEVWVSFLDFPMEFTQRPLVHYVLSSVG
ncbi:hypothetical protein LIER_42270 [Lithospermum erythrorhizon]|uniref:Uncharacterized protein n=1 Tax=Lithospermum erythrorhizon TaxID=34254 RepID=A0AAV3RM60_LITER